MDEAYNFRAPQYVDFASAVVHDNEDNDFFDFDMDTGAPIRLDITPTSAASENETVTSYEDAEDDNEVSSTHSMGSPKSRRCTSHKRQTLPRRSIFDGIEVEAAPEKAHSMKTRLDSVTRTPRLELRSRSIVKVMDDSPLDVTSSVDVHSPQAEAHHSPQEDIHHSEEERVPKRPVPAPRKRKLSETTHTVNCDGPPAKFISMAEHIIKLQKQTPARFRTKPRFDGVTKKTFGGPTAPKSITVPHTPALVSHLRSRPVHALTREEEELKEFEEAQKAKFKAIPLKENHFKSTRVAVVERKAPTQVQPFHLTEYKPKPRLPEEPPVVFKARPMPKTVRTGPKVEIAKKRKIPSPPPKPAPKSHPGPPKTRMTVVQPFSFENRGGFDPKAKREKLFKDLEELNRKAKEFKARPLPPKIKAAAESLPKRVKLTEEEAPVEKFKARSPVVLRKAPFIPAKKDRAPLEPKPFNLHSEARSHERQKYELILKQKELELEAQRRHLEEEEARRTAEEIAELRRKTVHHANPVPHRKPFQVKPSHAPLTNPYSPNFVKRRRIQKAATAEKLNTTFEIENA